MYAWFVKEMLELLLPPALLEANMDWPRQQILKFMLGALRVKAPRIHSFQSSAPRKPIILFETSTFFACFKSLPMTGTSFRFDNVIYLVKSCDVPGQLL